MKSINTAYNGVVYRSKLEAIWACFFNSIGLEYEYEPRLFNLDHGINYLPDFYLPKNDIWIEIKGPESSKTDLLKSYLLSKETGGHVFLFSGSPDVMMFSDGMRPCNFDAYGFGLIGHFRIYDLLEVLCAITESDRLKINKALINSKYQFEVPSLIYDSLQSVRVTIEEKTNGQFTSKRFYDVRQ